MNKDKTIKTATLIVEDKWWTIEQSPLDVELPALDGMALGEAVAKLKGMGVSNDNKCDMDHT